MKVKSILLLCLASLIFALGSSMTTTADESPAEVNEAQEPTPGAEPDARFVDTLPAECSDESETPDVDACPPAVNCTCDCGGTKGVPITLVRHGEKCADKNGAWCVDTVPKPPVYTTYSNCK